MFKKRKVQSVLAEVVNTAGTQNCGGAPRFQAVKVGGTTVLASGGMYLGAADMDPRLLHVPLTAHMTFMPGVRYSILPIFMRDFGGVPHNWPDLMDALVREIRGNTPVHIFCDGGLGRTGTVLASLIALMESAEETPDPIAAVRARYSHLAVETVQQARAIFALRGQPLSGYYVADFYERMLKLEALLAGRPGNRAGDRSGLSRSPAKEPPLSLVARVNRRPGG